MCPIIADSLDSFEETTTAACAAGSTERMSTAAIASDLRHFLMGHLRDADRDPSRSDGQDAINSGSDAAPQSAIERQYTMSFATRAVKARL
jgi:hypothetical protein